MFQQRFPEPEKLRKKKTEIYGEAIYLSNEFILVPFFVSLHSLVKSDQ